MDIEFDCPNCGQNITVDESGEGVTFECPKCAQSLVVPSPKKIKFSCSKCRQHLSFNESGAGKAVHCPKCGQSLTVPLASSTSSSTNLQDCPDCGRQVSKRAEACPHCGAPIASARTKVPPRVAAVPTITAPTTTRAWNPGIAAVLSFFIPGLGLLYRGEFGSALVFFLVVSFLYTMGVIAHPFWFLLGLAFHGICIHGSYKS